MTSKKNKLKAITVQDPMQGLREAMKTIAVQDPMQELHEAMKTIAVQDPMKGHQKTIKELKHNFETLLVAKFCNVINPLNWPETDQKDLIITANDTSIVIDDDVFDLDQINSQFENLTYQLQKDFTANFEEAINRIITEIQSLKDPILQKAFIYIIYPIIIALIFSIVNPITENYIKEYLERGKNIPVESNKQTESGSTISLTNLRVVTCEILNVREKPTSKSRKIANLKLGCIITFNEKEGNWSRITWTEKEVNIERKGWVFTRYIKNLE